MTFYYIEDENVLEGNNGSTYAEINDNGELRLDVDKMSQGVNKLRAMEAAIQLAIEANEE